MPNKTEGLTYAGVGIDYGSMDPFKRMAQLAARETTDNIHRLNDGEFREVEMSRGESAFLIEAAKSYFAHVEEGLGTKSLVADAMYELIDESFYDQIAQCTVAMIVNDMITLGALPLSVAMHLAVSDSSWFNDEQRCRDLVDGWEHACTLARCVWGGGETPTLKGVIVPGATVLSGSAIGIIKPKERLITGDIAAGDIIVLAESSGIHANGLTLARMIAERRDSIWRQLANFFNQRKYPLRALADGYLTLLSDGQTYGEALLEPTHIYVPLVEELLNAGVKIKYAINITGHGWRKLMRHPHPFGYIIERLPRQLPIFDFIQEYGQVSAEEMYGTFNMGAGFALIIPPEEVDRVHALGKQLAPELGYQIFFGGYVEASEKRRVVITPKNLVFEGESLNIR